jgi:hypothetical protein
MAAKRKLISAFYFLFFLCIVTLLACNNDTEKTENVDGPVPNDTAATAEVDTMENTKGNVASIVDTVAAIKPPKASLAYAYKSKMKKGDQEQIQVNA